MAKVLLINPNTRYLGSMMTILPPLGLLYIASTLKREGHEVKVVDADVENLSQAEVLKTARDYAPDLIGLTMNTLQSRAAYETVEQLKRAYDAPVIAGGPHPSALKGEVLERCPSLDAVVYGEGEATTLEILKAFEDGRDLADVEGICYRQGEEILTTEPRCLVDIDSLPHPALELVAPIGRYHGAYPVGARPSLHIMASRGCPFQCTFCSKGIWERSLRLRKVDSVLAEVEWLRDTFRVKEIFFQDDTLNVNRGWFESLCSGLVELGLNKKVKFKGPFRANEKMVDPDILKMAKDAGFWMIFYGVESGNQRVLDSIKKGITLRELERAFQITKKAGIKTYASFMIGNLGESRETIKDTIRFARKLDPDYYGFAVATPYPGCEFYEAAKRGGYLLADFEDYDLNRYVLKTESLGPEDVQELMDTARRSMQRDRHSLLGRLLDRDTGVQTHCVPVYDYFPATSAPSEDLLSHEIVMGESDWDVLGPGWYGLERWPPVIRWTGKKAIAYLKGQPGQVCLCIKATGSRVGPNLTISVNGNPLKAYKLEPDWAGILKAPLENGEGIIRLDLEVDETLSPRDFGEGDERELGVAVERIWLKNFDH